MIANIPGVELPEFRGATLAIEIPLASKHAQPDTKPWKSLRQCYHNIRYTRYSNTKLHCIAPVLVGLLEINRQTPSEAPSYTTSQPHATARTHTHPYTRVDHFHPGFSRGKKINRPHYLVTKVRDGHCSSEKEKPPKTNRPDERRRAARAAA